MQHFIYDYSKLYGVIKESKMSQEIIAKKAKIGRTSLNLSLNNKRPFKQDEIERLSKILEISENKDEYFFTLKV